MLSMIKRRRVSINNTRFKYTHQVRSSFLCVKYFLKFHWVGIFIRPFNSSNSRSGKLNLKSSHIGSPHG